MISGLEIILFYMVPKWMTFWIVILALYKIVFGCQILFLKIYFLINGKKL
jgi:hypothetical protein